MSDRNRNLSRRWFEEVWNERRAATIEELMSPEAVGHMESGDVSGVEPFRRLHGEFLAAFPDLELAVEDLVSEGDDVVIRWRATGTHTGDGLGFEATHRPVAIRGITWQRFNKDGKLTEGWDSWNHEALVRELRDGSDAQREHNTHRRMELAGRLREIRRELFGEHGGPELARKLGLPVRTYYNYETGVTIPAEILLDFIDQTGVRPAWLHHGEDPRYEGGGDPGRSGVRSAL